MRSSGPDGAWLAGDGSKRALQLVGFDTEAGAVAFPGLAALVDALKRPDTMAFDDRSRPEFGPIWSQALVMGVLTAIMQFAIYGGLALAAGQGRDALVGNPQVTIWIGRGAGALFLAVALFTAWHGVTLQVEA